MIATEQSRKPKTAVFALLLLFTGLAHAQQVFRIVGPDGRVTFSDRPAPTPAEKASTARPVAPAPEKPGNGAAASATASLPYELRTVAERYPVTLYTSKDCQPCANARSLLQARGVPFTEKTIDTAADADALQRISGDTSLPFATIGAQQLKGFAAPEWTQYLDAAAYPAQSQLPPTYRVSAPQPLVAAQAAVRPAPGAGNTAAAAAGRAPGAQSQRVAPTPRPAPNPAGIQF